MNAKRGMTGWRRLALLAGLAVSGNVFAAGAAFADPPWADREWREHHGHEHRHWRHEDDDEGPVMAAPPVVVAQPPAIYVPPPVVAAPMPLPSVNLVFPINIR